MSEKHDERISDRGVGQGAADRTAASGAAVGKRTLVGGMERQLSGAAPQLEGGSIQLPDGLRADAGAGPEGVPGSGTGEPLPASIQTRLSAAAGSSLAGVRVHQGAESEAASTAMGARAFTIGQDIHFGAGEYDPSSPHGMHLLAHEVAHTVQQGAQGAPQLKGLDVSQPGDSFETEADSFAGAIVAGTPPPNLRAGSAALSIARYAGAAPPPPPAPAVEAAPGTIVAAPVPGSTTGVDPRSGGYAGPESASRGVGVEAERERIAAERSTPTVTTALGGRPPDFTSSRGGAEYEGTTTGGRVNYQDRRFHLLDALAWDMELAETPAEVASIRWAYAERPFGRPTPPRTYRDGDGQEQTLDFKLPEGAAGHVLQFGVDWRYLSDSDETLVTATYVLALDKRRKKVPALDVMVRPERRGPSVEVGDAQADKRRSRRRKKPRIVLHLPSQKAPHLGRYQTLVGGGQLISPEGYERDASIEPRDKWLANVGPGKAFDVDAELADEGRKLVRDPRLLSIPDWSRTSQGVKMHVDHIVELQVVRDQARYDDFRNYELLDASSNMSSGAQLSQNILRERKRLAREEGDLSYMTAEIEFTEVTLDGGDSGERWSLGEIKRAEHIIALIRLKGLKQAKARR